ncbi:hypothetical protein Tco_0894896 [Tanacetum coccineum]|uniref:Uncharacterized protein n=1 Tax=Tanacetum coccineum TaxID=301880 RepID=A0ABQ5CJA8_9ASTR
MHCSWFSICFLLCLFCHRVLLIYDLEDMKKRLKEIEEEVGALPEMQAKVEKEMGSAQAINGYVKLDVSDLQMINKYPQMEASVYWPLKGQKRSED